MNGGEHGFQKPDQQQVGFGSMSQKTGSVGLGVSG
jgi:hypothetical protein